MNVDYESRCMEIVRLCGSEIKYKNESRIMRFANVFVRLFNKRFMSDYANVIGSTLWMPSRESYEKADKRWLYAFLIHEMHHVLSTRKHTAVGMFFGYGFPQSMAVVLLPIAIAFYAVGGASFIPFWVSLAACVFSALPLPAYLRVKEEVSAEAAAEKVRRRIGIPSVKENLFRNVCSWEYYNPLYKIEWAEIQFSKRISEGENGGEKTTSMQ